MTDDTEHNHAVIYDVDTGKIVLAVSVTESQSIAELYPVQQGQAYLYGEGVENPDGYVVQDGAIVPASPEELSVDDMRMAAKFEIDRIAGVVRSDFVSQGFGQEMTYLAKEDEARRYMADDYATDTAYPMIAAEVGITGEDMAAVAGIVIARSNEWRSIAGNIEAVRRSAKQSIEAATTQADIDQIIATAQWPQNT